MAQQPSCRHDPPLTLGVGYDCVIAHLHKATPQLDRADLVDDLQADKLSITHELGIQVRDLRILDPAMATSYPSAVLCREKALLVNLEHIKCIITSSYLLLLNADQPSVLQFAEDVKYRLAHPSQPRPAKANPPKAKPKSKVGNLLRPSKSDTDLETYLLINGSDPSDSSSMSSGPDRELPFELKVTETVLDTVSHISALLPYCISNNMKKKRELLDVLAALSDTHGQATMMSISQLASTAVDYTLSYRCQCPYGSMTSSFCSNVLSHCHRVCLLQVCHKLAGMTDELWQAGAVILKNPTAHTVSHCLNACCCQQTCGLSSRVICCS